MNSNEWIKLHRKIQEHPYWLKEKFTKIQAWIDLILLANFEDKEIVVDYKSLIIKRGQHMTSQAKLAKRWCWDRQTVKRFLTCCEVDKMLSYECHKGYETGFTVITILNYDEYQEIQQGNPQGNHRASHINKNDKNDKNIKSNIEYETFISTFNSLFGKNYRATTGLQTKYEARRKVFTADEILSATAVMAKDKFYRGENARKWQADPTFILRNDEQIDKFRVKSESESKPKVSLLADLVPDRY